MATFAEKYTTANTEVTPLRTELVTQLPSAGTYTVSLSLACGRWDASPFVSVLDNDTLIATELFEAR